MTVSAPLTVTVKANVPPSVALTKPLGNVSYAAPGMVALAVNAADSDGTLTKVAYFQGGTQIAMSTVAPFAASWSNVAIGDYSITAKAYDDKGGITTSAAVPISVKANVLLKLYRSARRPPVPIWLRRAQWCRWRRRHRTVTARLPRSVSIAARPGWPRSRLRHSTTPGTTLPSHLQHHRRGDR
ncbi:Ig-like domain-containing protein [Massilia sp. H-1]|nr:Ig-like domain-containing protein [Massilia sp. H-1]